MNKTKALSLSIFGVIIMMLSSCNGSTPAETKTPAVDEDEIPYVHPSLDTYHNYIEVFDDKGNIYQIGDPYILRWNGKYYLYSSNTSGNTTNGIPCWVSKNMIDWEFCSWVYGDGTPGSGETYTEVAYAPEVVYYNGYFYMCEAPNGKGHYIFRCDTPYGKFVRCSENIGLGIDGSLYVENDRLILLSAVSGYSDGTISYSILTVNSDGTITAGIRTGIAICNLNGWTEGPGQFERNGYRYLTYTGNHVNASSYRVGYSYTKQNSLFKGLTNLDNNIILLSTGDDEPYNYSGGYNSDSSAVQIDNFRGLGHSSNVVGPNLDSEFIVYHNAGRINYNNVSGSNFNRRYNVSQLFNDGKNLTVNGFCNYQAYKPFSSDFSLSNEGDSFEENGEFQLSNKSTKDIYTIEANIKLNNDEGQLIISYVDDNNYAYILISENSLKAYKHSNGTDYLIGSANILISDNKDAYHTIKVVNGTTKATVYYDNQRKIVCNSLGASGKVGVNKNNFYGAIEFTNDAYGTSDFETIKNLNSTFPAYTYLKEEKRGFKIADSSIKDGGVRQGEKESTESVDEETIVKLKKNDWVKYAINAPADGLYNLYLKINKKSCGSKLRVVVDESDAYDLMLGTASYENEQYIMVNAGQFEIKTAGIHSLKILCDSNAIEFSQVLTQKSQGVDSFSNSLINSFEQGRLLIGNVAYSAKGLSTKSSEPETVVYFGDKGNTNFTLKVDVTLGYGDAGIIFRAQNYSYTNQQNVSSESHALQGYYLVLGENGALNLYKYNYSIMTLAFEAPQDSAGKIIAIGKALSVVVVCIDNHIEIYLNGVKYIDCIDEYPFVTGYSGFCTKKSQADYKNLNYKIY